MEKKMEARIEEFRQLYENLNDFGKEKMTDLMEEFSNAEKAHEHENHLSGDFNYCQLNSNKYGGEK